jgi:hypothetical protein
LAAHVTCCSPIPIFADAAPQKKNVTSCPLNTKDAYEDSVMLFAVIVTINFSKKTPLNQQHIYIVRRPKEWISYNHLTINNCQNLHNLVNSWNSIFNISYLDFRKALNKIRECNLKNTKFKNIINWLDQPRIKEQLKSNNFIYCTDDDDWYHDDIIDIIESCKTENYNSFRWNYLAYEPSGNLLLTDQKMG